MIQNQSLTLADLASFPNETPTFINAERSNEQQLQDLMKGDIPIKFDWKNRWLKGEEYAHIL